MAAPSLTLTEELLLLALDDDGSFLPLTPGALDYALAGSLLMGLALRDRIDEEGDNVRVEDTKSQMPREPMLAHALQKIMAEKTPQPLAFWIRSLAADGALIKQTVLSSLITKGILTYKESRLAWVFKSGLYPVADDRLERSTKIKLVSALWGDEMPDPRDICLVALADACNLLPQFISEREMKATDARVEDMKAKNLIGQAVADAITEAAEAAAPELKEKRKGKKKKHEKRGKPQSWEWRAFWPGDGPLPAPLTHTISAQKQERERTIDQYLLTSKRNANIKIRGDEVQIKPVLQSYKTYQAFQGKQDVKFPVKLSKLGTLFPELADKDSDVKSMDKLVEVLGKYDYQPQLITVQKERYTLEPEPGVKMELALLLIGKNQYWTACVESHNFTRLEHMVQNISPKDAIVCGYMDFLHKVVEDIVA